MTDLVKLTNDIFGINNFLREDTYLKTGDIDIVESDNDYQVEMDLPGFNENEVDITVDKGYLTISANKEETKEKKDKESKKYIMKQRSSRSVSRSFKLGENIDVNNVNAKLEKGVLTLKLGKKEETKPVQIKIN